MADSDFLQWFKNAPSTQQLVILRDEIVTPVSTIRGYVALMKKTAQTEIMPADFDEYIDNIAQAADKIWELLNALRESNSR
jgi:hypothetical protein